MDKKVLVQRLDRLVSILVRRGEDRCATCGRRLPWRYRQAGHFVPRVVQETRWDLDNVHVQCAHCNVELGGNIPAYRKFIAERYGKDFLAALDTTYDMYKHGKLKAYSLENMIALYNSLWSLVHDQYPDDLPEGWKKIE